MRRVYEANFKGRIPLGEHHNGVDQSMIDMRLAGLHPLILDGQWHGVATFRVSGLLSVAELQAA